MRAIVRRHLASFAAIGLLGLTACPEEIKAPVAKIGGDTNGSVNVAVRLNGSASSDPQGLSLTYNWRITSQDPPTTQTSPLPGIIRLTSVAEVC